MVDKLIMLTTLVLMSPEGELNAVSVPSQGVEFKVLTFETCATEKKNADVILSQLLEANKDTPGPGGNKLIAAIVNCVPVTPENFATFSSTFASPN